MADLMIKLQGDHQWYNQGQCVLEDLLSAIRRTLICEAKWGKFHMLATVVCEHTYYQMWMDDGPIYDEEDLGKIEAVIRENL